jgi:hypothetical protein
MATSLLGEAIEPNVRSAILRTVEERFGAKGIYAVDVTRDEDPDGGDLYTVKIVLDDNADLARFHGDRLAGLVRLLRRSLEKEGDSTFPLVRMMSKRDAKLLAREKY